MKRALVILLIIVLCLSFVYAAVESVHDCDGEAECPICKIIAVLSRIFTSVAVLFLSVLVLYLIRSAANMVARRAGVTFTLIDLRVKLSF